MDFLRNKRQHFTRDIVLVVLLLAAAVLGSVTYFAFRAHKDISQNYIDAATASAVRQFEAMVASMTRSLELAGDWIVTGKLSPADADALNGLLIPLLKRDPMLSGISVADPQGNSYYVTPHETGWKTRRIWEVDGRRQAVVRYWSADQQPLAEEKRLSSYDPRSRPWFAPALAQNGVFWTRPYIFFDRQVVGITASLAREVVDGGDLLVLAFDILLADLFHEIQRMAPSANSRVFIFREDAQIYVPGDGRQPSDFRAVPALGDPMVRKMIDAWGERHLPSGEAFSLVNEGGTWWCGFRAMEDTHRNVWVGVMVPEADITGGVVRRRAGLWTAGGLVMLLAGGLAVFMIRRYGRSFEAPEGRYDRRQPAESIRQLIDKGEGRSIEFKSTMRMNLHTGKPGKEIEIAWLKAVAAFMNTEGGTLLLGVSDDGVIQGLEADGFTSDDKCRLHFKNLVNQHIGAEFSRYLRFDIVRVDQKAVGVVACRPSAEPVYLKTAKAEDFYIRNGPSSEALPVSKALAYIQNRR